TKADGSVEQIAEGYEHSEQVTALVESWPQRWIERRLMVRWLAQARTAEEALRTRLSRAQAALSDLSVRRRGKAPLPDTATAQQLVEKILARFQVAEVLKVSVTEQLEQRRIRAYRERAARVQETKRITITHAVDTVALSAAIARLGWR